MTPRLPCSRLTLVLALAFLPVACASSGPPSPQQKDAIVRKIGARLHSKAFVLDTDWSDWDRYVEDHRSAIDAATTQEELGNALSDALDKFDVSHLWVWTPAEIRLRKRGLRGGLGLKTVAVADGRLVTMVLPESAALAAGLRKGDVVVSARGEPVAADFASGMIGETISIGWRRGDETFVADLVFGSSRRAAPPSLRWLDGGIAWITVPTFSQGVYEARTIDALFREAASAEALVIDLRSNGGGRLTNVEHLIGHVLEPGTAIYREIWREHYDISSNTTGQTVRSPRGVSNTPYLGPLAVIVDGRSGSGGDLVPATVQSLERGVVVGTPTTGKVLIGDDYRLPGGYVLFYPRAEMVRIDGQRMEGYPVQPDVLLTPEETVDDAVLERVVRAQLVKVP